MFFDRKDNKKEIREIKKAVSDEDEFKVKPFPTDFGQRRVPTSDFFSNNKQTTSVDLELRDELERPIKKSEERSPMKRPVPRLRPPSTQEIGAPLFVKVEKYREALTTLQEIKSFLAGIKQTFSILAELEAVRNDTLKLMRATIERLERDVTELDSGLLRPQGIPQPGPKSETEVKHIEDSLSNLHNQIRTLKSELDKFK